MTMKVRYNVMNGEVHSEVRGGVRKLYSLDPLGNTRALYDATQTKTDTFSYFPSGMVAARTGTTPTPFQWNGGSGYFTDSSTRKYVRARNYHNNLGRWNEQDPIGFDGGDFNLYRYVKNRFVVMNDPSGLVTLTPVDIDSWSQGRTPPDPPIKGGKNDCCCGAYQGQWSLDITNKGRFKCQNNVGAFVQYIKITKFVYHTCSSDIFNNCIGYLELFPVTLDNGNNIIGALPVDTFYHRKNGKATVPTWGDFAASAESKFFCAENIDFSGFQEGLNKGSDACNGYSGYAAYMPIKKDADLPAWYKKSSQDGVTPYHYGDAQWDCCTTHATGGKVWSKTKLSGFFDKVADNLSCPST